MEENLSKLEELKMFCSRKKESPGKKIKFFKDKFLELLEKVAFNSLSEELKSEVVDIVFELLKLPRRKKKSIIKLDDELLGECEKLLIKSREDREEKEKSLLLDEKGIIS